MFSDASGKDVTISASSIQAITNTGTSIVLQANNDITVNQAIVTSAGGNGGHITMQAGRSILLNADITTDNGNLTLVANETLANGVVDAHRDAGDAVIAMASGVKIDAGTGAVTITLADGAGKTNVGSGSIVLRDIDAGSITVSNLGNGTAADVELHGALAIAGAANLVSNRSIIGHSGASVTTQGGDIVVNANRDATGSGNIQLTGTTIASNGGAITLGGGTDPLTTAAVGTGTGTAQQRAGIYLSGSSLNAGSGAISLRGQGVAGTGNAYGIHLLGASEIGSATSTGDITLHGTGGAGTTNGWGVNLVGADTAVRSLSGNISITGQGGAGTGDFQYGIMLWQGAKVVSTGSAGVTLSGTGGNGASNNHGFYMDGAGTEVTSAGGAVSITGRGNGSGTGNYGIYLDTQAKVLGSGSASVTLDGTGGSGSDTNHGIYLLGSGTRVAVENGALSITGQGAGSGAGNYGAYLNNRSEVAASGTGNITIHGTGGGAGSSVGNHGIGAFDHAITANSGSISLTGVGGAAGATNYGILLSGTNVADSRIATNGAITLTGQGGGTGSGNRGVVIGGAPATVVQAGSGALNITGTGSATGTGGSNDGIWITTGGLVSSSSGKITLDGTAQGTGNQSVGVVMGGGGKITATNAAEIDITGRGSVAGGDYNFGFYIIDANTAVTGQSGAISITGIGGGNGTLNQGIRFAGTAPPIATTTGGITLTGHAAAGTAEGILLHHGARVGGSGTTGDILLVSQDSVHLGDGSGAGHVQTGAGGGSITVRADQNIVLRQGSTLTTQGQAIVLNADRDATDGGSIRLIDSTITSNGGDVTLGGGADPTVGHARGFGSGSEFEIGDRQYGVFLHNTSLSSGAGNIHVRGEGHVNGDNNIGVRFEENSNVNSTTGEISIAGLGGSANLASQGSLGFYLQHSSIASTTGAITITGTARAASGMYNFGLGMKGTGANTARVESASGDITLVGVGAGDAATGYGVLLSGTAWVLSSGTSDITLTGTSPGGGTDFRVEGAGPAILGGPSATGDITVNADTVDWGATLLTLQSSGILTIQPRTDATSIGVGDGSAGTLNLDNAELDGIQGGFDEIVIGSASGTGDMETGSYLFADNLRLRIGGSLAVKGDLSTGAKRLALLAGGGATQTGKLTAGELRLGGDGDFVLENTGNSIGTLAKDGTGSVSLRNAGALTVGTVDGVSGVTGSTVDLRALSGDLTLNQAVTGTGSGSYAVALSTLANFINNAGASAVQTPSSRWLVYSNAPAGNTFDGLNSGQAALYGRTVASDPPAGVAESGNRYLFADAPSLTVEATLSDSKTYGDTYAFPAPVLGTHYSVSGFVDAASYGNVFTQDTLASIGLSGAPVLSSTGAPATAAVSLYLVDIAQGTLANTAGYGFTFNSGGALTVNPRAITLTPDAGQSKIYGDADPALTYTVGGLGLVNGDTLSGALGRAAGENVGSYAINQGTLAASGNYAVTFTSGVNFVIGQRAITLTADPATKIYGNLDPALGVSLATGSTLATGDTLADVTGTIGRESGNTVGVYDIQLGTGSKAGNYTITFDADNDAFTITPKTINLNGVAANGKTYDGTTTATFDLGGASLNGVLVGDMVQIGTGSGTFAQANAGTGIAVTATGFTLVGADAGNYTLAAQPTGLSANIAPKALTITANDANRAQDQGNPLFSATYAGFVPGEGPGHLSGTLVFSTVSGYVPVGAYAITPSGLFSGNYAITFVDGTLTVWSAPEWILSSGRELLETYDMAKPWVGLLDQLEKFEDREEKRDGGKVDYEARNYEGAITTLRAGEGLE